jgi:hypothetical protein
MQQVERREEGESLTSGVSATKRDGAGHAKEEVEGRRSSRSEDGAVAERDVDKGNACSWGPDSIGWSGLLLRGGSLVCGEQR